MQICLYRGQIKWIIKKWFQIIKHRWNYGILEIRNSQSKPGKMQVFAILVEILMFLFQQTKESYWLGHPSGKVEDNMPCSMRMIHLQVITCAKRLCYLQMRVWHKLTTAQFQIKYLLDHRVEILKFFIHLHWAVKMVFLSVLKKNQKEKRSILFKIQHLKMNRWYSTQLKLWMQNKKNGN